MSDRKMGAGDPTRPGSEAVRLQRLVSLMTQKELEEFDAGSDELIGELASEVHLARSRVQTCPRSPGWALVEAYGELNAKAGMLNDTMRYAAEVRSALKANRRFSAENSG